MRRPRARAPRTQPRMMARFLSPLLPFCELAAAPAESVADAAAAVALRDEEVLEELPISELRDEAREVEVGSLVADVLEGRAEKRLVKSELKSVRAEDPSVALAEAAASDADAAASEDEAAAALAAD